MIKFLPEILAGTFVVFIATFVSSYYGFTPSNWLASITAEVVFFRLVYLGTHFLFTWKKRARHV
ncbi:hypothetical protein [Fructobacillus papyrifericola]|uniref:Uncharacterized protein n=1 Tax=Fructobacillus papyrifericola TaxID=2713172 RepID=A0ABS5QT32_9LACO|nr:hypothetical protein [Fructobacillus papyrifericola]MBS9335987.1 hypothetical protein [Fructobacillus papyrifericola]